MFLILLILILYFVVAGAVFWLGMGGGVGPNGT